MPRHRRSGAIRMHRDKFTCTDAYGRTFGNFVHPSL